MGDLTSRGGAGDDTLPPGTSSGPAARSAVKTTAVAFIYVTIALDATGIGILIPIIPKLIEQLGGGRLQLAAVYGGWSMASSTRSRSSVSRRRFSTGRAA